MPNLTELQNAVTTLLDLPSIPSVLQLNSPTRERAFEAYIFSLFVKAIRQIGGTVVIRGIQSGDNPASVVFRGSPGRLGSRSQDFAYAFCSLGDEEFELHLDVQYQGSSGAIHEVDVSIFDHDAAEQIRQSAQAANLFPGSRKLFGAVECKFYDSNLGTALGRTFVGLVADCGTLKVRAFASNGQHSGLVKYFAPQSRPNRFLGLSPLSPDEEDRFVRWIEQTLREWTKAN